MSQPMIRAFSVQQELEFIDQYFDEDTRERVKGEIPADLQSTIWELKPVEHCPIDYSSTVLRAISSAKNDPEGSFNDIVECGRFISVEATNTFYKLLLKVVTPTIFLNKMQSFWSKDFKDAGVWAREVAASGNSATMTLKDVAGLDHLAPMSQGFICYVIESMGQENVRCEVKGWSLENPGPAEIEYHLSWG